VPIDDEGKFVLDEDGDYSGLTIVGITIEYSVDWEAVEKYPFYSIPVILNNSKVEGYEIFYRDEDLSTAQKKAMQMTEDKLNEIAQETVQEKRISVEKKEVNFADFKQCVKEGRPLAEIVIQIYLHSKGLQTASRAFQVDKDWSYVEALRVMQQEFEELGYEVRWMKNGEIVEKFGDSLNPAVIRDKVLYIEPGDSFKNAVRKMGHELGFAWFEQIYGSETRSKIAGLYPATWHLDDMVRTGGVHSYTFKKVLLPKIPFFRRLYFLMKNRIIR